MRVPVNKKNLECTQKHWPSVPDVCEQKLTYSTDEYLLSDDERAILRNVPPIYKYIARDDDFRLYLYEGLPRKDKTIWKRKISNECGSCTLLPFNHLFQCIKWADQKPWMISDLLEAKKPTVDWSKVPVDTKILVGDNADGISYKRYFAKYENGKVYGFCNGCTSFTASKYPYATWKYAKLYEAGDE